MVSKSSFVFDANRLCLDFVNTVILRQGERLDLLRSFEDLLRWLRAAGALDSGPARESEARWAGRSAGEYALHRALDLRSDLRALVDAVLEGRAVEEKHLRILNELLAGRSRIPYAVPATDGASVHFRTVFEKPDDLLVPVAESTLDLLTADDLSAVGRCDSSDCLLVYYDTSKNRSRRWCSMERCGNRAKVAAHAQRHRDPRGERRELQP